jgi:hypothetical protein
MIKAIKIGLLSLLLAPSFASSAYAAQCRLHQPWTPVSRGALYSFSADIPTSWGGSIPYPTMPLTIYWHGTKNGIQDTPPGGVFSRTSNFVGYHDLGTFKNLWNGSVVGSYTRWIVVKDGTGATLCTSNAVPIVLQ